MLFLNEKLIACLLSIMAFFVAFGTSCAYHTSLQAALLRGLISAFIFLFIGFIFGNVIKNLIVEAFITHKIDKDKIITGEAPETDEMTTGEDEDIFKR